MEAEMDRHDELVEVSKLENEVKLSELENEIEKLKQVGRESGLSEEEINSCMSQSLLVDLDWIIYWKEIKAYGTIAQEHFAKYIKPHILKHGQDLKRHVYQHKFQYFLALFISVVLLVIIGLYQCLFSHEGIIARWLFQIINPYDRFYMRLIRLVAVPFHALLNLGAYHNMPCLVYNPSYIEIAPEDCLNCMKFNKTVIAKQNNVTMHSKFLKKPIIFKKYHQYDTTLQNITDLIQANYDKLNDPSIVLQSTVPWLKQPIDLVKVNKLEEKILSESNLHMQWISRRMSTSQIIRDLFPRPVFLTNKSEILFTRQLLIDGPGATEFSLSEDADGAIIYAVHRGNRTLNFVPKRGCESRCAGFQTIVEAGDVIVIKPRWDIWILQNTDEISIASVAYVALK